jgi:hypothetical protein
MSSAADEREEEDGREDTSTQDSIPVISKCVLQGVGMVNVVLRSKKLPKPGQLESGISGYHEPSECDRGIMDVS